MRFPREFDIKVTDKIIDESIPGDCYMCAVANAVKECIPFDDVGADVDVTYGSCVVEENIVYIEADYLYWNIMDGNTDESISFQFVMDSNLTDWMDAFDRGEKVPPVMIDTKIYSEDVDNFVVGIVNGAMNLREILYE